MSEITRPLGPAIKRALLLKGASTPLELDGRVLVTAKAAELDHLPYLDDDTFSDGLTIAPVAGQVAWFVVQPSSGYLLVLDRFWYTGAAVMFVHLQLGVSGAFPGVAATTVQQAGNFGVPSNVNRLAPGTWTAGTSATAPVASDSVWKGVIPAVNGMFGPVEGPWVIDDGHQLALVSQTANVEFTYSVYGRLIKAR